MADENPYDYLHRISQASQPEVVQSERNDIDMSVET